MRLTLRLRDWPWAFKLVVLLVTTAIVPVAVLTLYSDIVLRREAVGDESARNLQRARNTVALIDEYLRDLMADVSIVAHASPTRAVLAGSAAPTEHSELAELLAHVKRSKDLPQLLVVDQSGRVVAATDARLMGSSRSALPFFRSAMAGERRIHDPRFVALDGEIYMHASAPVLDVESGRVLGVVAARIPLAPIDQLIAADTNFGSRGEFGLLWDANGVTISSPAAPQWRFRPLGTLAWTVRDELVAENRYGPDTARLLETPGPADPLVQQSRARMGHDGGDPVSRSDLGDGLLQVASVSVSDRGWTYAIAAPEQDVLLQARAQRNRNILAALLTTLLAFGLAIGSARWLARPLDQVRETAQALAAGDMHRRTHLDGRDEIGQMARAFDSMADAMAQKDAELRLHADLLERRVGERTAELAGVLAAIPDLIFKVSRDGRILSYSVPPGEELALAPESFLGRRITDVLPSEVSLPAMAMVERVLAGEPVAPFEYQLHLAGELQHYEARGSATSGDSVVFLVRNVTDRRHHEERMRFLARAGSALTASLDYGSIVETLAQLPVPFMAEICVVELLEDGAVRCAAVAARTPELHALMRALRAAHPVDLASSDPVAVALRKGLAHFQATPSPRSERLSPIAPRSLIVLPLIARGQTLGAMTLLTVSDTRTYSESDFAVAQELTHRAGIALDNARLYRDMQEASRLKDEFLGIVSHELRTPLNAVLGWSQVLRRAPADPEQTRRAVLAIERNAQAQARLVEDLLDASRVISGKIRLRPGPVDVRALVRAAVDSFVPLARAAGLELSLDVPEAPLEARADAARLQQVMGNLLSNALKFTHAGGRINVQVRREGPNIEMRVSDTGAGIPSDFLPHVFDRFRQADSTTTRAHGGLGIGLAIVRHLVELHGGTISAASDGVGRGSTFVVVLPAGEVPERVDPSPGAAATLARCLGGIHILAVDDSPDARELVRTVLSEAGAVVSVASSVQDALPAIEAAPPDLLLADIGMPGQDGNTLIRFVRSVEAQTGRPRMPAVALTAYAREEDRARSLAAGYDACLIKPIEPAALVEALTALLKGFAGSRA